MELLFHFLTRELSVSSESAAKALWRDYQRGGRYDKPSFLKDFLEAELPAERKSRASLPKRQARHVVQ
jgi:hypothetical protein